ncbi:MAG: FkbM family methyltransferase [Butyrivibrio sp.]|nr:FkbM family methyltransferase [Butyrivibrio sp.]
MQNIKKYLPQLQIICFIDDNRIRNNEDVEGLKVLSLQEVMEQESDFTIIITNYYVSSVLAKIEAKGFDLNKVFFWSQFLIEDVDHSYLIKNKDNLYRAYDCLEDYLSKMIFENMVTARFDKNIDLLGRTCEKEQYFPDDIFILGNEEVFVDAGAYDGDTIDTFLKHTKQKYKYIYAFEPDKTNYERLLTREYSQNIKVYNAGLYCETGEMNFGSNRGGSSKIEEDGIDIVQVIKFDDLELPEDRVSFIKMDIEGSELNALQGMQETIKKNKPKLAICIYHKFEDLWELPLYIKSLVPEYKLYIRNYTSYLDEIVLYAVI